MTTIKDISKRCHVSISTVSRALNGYDDINSSTKELVLKVAKELDYIPNKHARALIKRNNNNLVIITSSLNEKESIFDILRGLYRFGEEENYSISIFTSSLSKKHGKSYYKFCRENDIAGAMLYGLDKDDKDVIELINKKFPVVTINSDISGEKVVSISIDNFKAAYEAVTSLIKSGCKRIATIQGEKELYVTKERIKGYIEALAKNNIEIRKDFICYGDFSKESGEDSIERLIDNNIDGVFCASDNIAIGAYEGLKKRKIKIPESVSVVGFGDKEIARYLTPTLSSVKEDMYRLGYEGGQILGNIIKGKKLKAGVNVDYEFIRRKSIK
ncbi:LacI family DNA-binding transcriptional regulator [Clostridium perfringens]|nr:LacI family DNA-binding transcriptional regulator [Clostridium perfringens]